MEEVPKMCSSRHKMPLPRGHNLLPCNKTGGGDVCFSMGPAVTDPSTGGPFALLNKNIESERRKFVTADACNLANPLNMDYCYERSRQSSIMTGVY